MQIELSTKSVQFGSDNREVHLPNGDVASLVDVINVCPYTLDYNLSYFLHIIESFIALDSSHKNYYFLVTRRVDELPKFEPQKLRNLIVFLLGDEWCRTPSYASHVFAVFKCYGSTPSLKLHGSNVYLNSLIVLQHLRVLLKGVRGKRSARTNIFPFPLGYFRQSDLPVKPILEGHVMFSLSEALKTHPNSEASVPSIS